MRPTRVFGLLVLLVFALSRGGHGDKLEQDTFSSVPPPPLKLEQWSGGKPLPVGGVAVEGSVELLVTVEGSVAEESLIVEIEVRRGNILFNKPTVRSAPLTYTGTPITVRIPLLHLPVGNYHWRARVRNALGPGPWLTFGENSDDIDPPFAFADADFRSLYMELSPQAREPIGYEGLILLSRLPYLKQGTRAHMVSSFQRNGGNADIGGEFYREGGDSVVLDVHGPGQIDRIWFTGFDPPGFRVRIYLDNASTPVVDMPAHELTSGRHPPFVYPLVLDQGHASGGRVSFVPIPFRTRARVLFSGGFSYYQINYRTFESDEGITTFTGREDYTLAQWVLSRAGQDPAPGSITRTLEITTTVPPGQKMQIAHIAGPGAIRSIRLRLPQLEPSLVARPPLTDDVRCYADGFAEFDISLPGDNQGARLWLRRDRTRGPQKARVYVDGVLAGVWQFERRSDVYRWFDDMFTIPLDLVRNKTSLRIHLDFSDTPEPWCEARYWTEANVNSKYVRTDEIDIGNAESEKRHNHVFSGVSSTEMRTNTYSPTIMRHKLSEDLLHNTWIIIYFDGQPEPAVETPLGQFFGSAVGLVSIRSLMFGMEPEIRELYTYWPMPFWSEARLIIDNRSTQTINPLGLSLIYSTTPYEGLGTQAGYFHARYRSSEPTVLGQDHVILEDSGRGHFVGTELYIAHDNGGFLEGDDRTYVDESGTPLHGTGTEDYFNSAFYYERGVYSAPLHGSPVNRAGGMGFDQYRLFLADALPFERHLRVGIEHGGQNDLNANYYSVAWYYALPEPVLYLTDEVNLGHPESWIVHNVHVQGPSRIYTLTSSYVGDFDDVLISDTGLVIGSGARIQLHVHIDPENTGLRLTRRLDQAIANQRAHVYVNGIYAGEWYDGGVNPYARWADSSFDIPAELLQGLSEVEITLEQVPTSLSSEFSIFHLWVWTRKLHHSTPTPTPTPTTTLTPTTTFCPDFDKNGLVNEADLAHIVNVWRATGADVLANYDFNTNGIVDIEDILIVARNVGKKC